MSLTIKIYKKLHYPKTTWDSNEVSTCVCLFGALSKN